MFYKRIGIILLVGVLIYLPFMNGFNAWCDEQFTLYVIGQSWRDMLSLIMTQDGHPPLHYILMKLWMTGLDFHAVGWARILSMLFVLLTAALGAGPVRRLCGDKVALWFAGLVIAMPVNLFLASDMRMYGLLGLETTAAVVYALLARRDGKRRDWLTFLGVSVALLYTHYFGGLILFVLNAFLFFSFIRRPVQWRNLRYQIGVGIVAGACFLPWFIGVFLGQANHMYQDWFPTFGALQSAIFATIHPMFGAFTFGRMIGYAFFSLCWVLLIQFVWDARKDKNRTVAAVPVILYFSVLMMACIISYTLRPMMSWRYLLEFWSPLALGLAVIMVNEKRFLKIFLILLAGVFCSFYVFRLQSVHAPFYRILSSHVRQNVSRDASLILCDGTNTCLTLAYYFPEYKTLYVRINPDLMVLEELHHKYVQNEEDLDAFSEFYIFTQSTKLCQKPLVIDYDHGMHYCFTSISKEDAKNLLQFSKKQDIM